MACAASTETLVLLESSWRLSPSVALRPEPFGALAYHFGNRKLTFLKRPELVAVVKALDTMPTVAAALEAAGVSVANYPSYLRALGGLAATDMIQPKEETP